MNSHFTELVLENIDPRFCTHLRELIAKEKAIHNLINEVMNRAMQVEIEKTKFWEELLANYALDPKVMYHLDIYAAKLYKKPKTINGIIYPIGPGNNN